jgi:hypothetical protein
VTSRKSEITTVHQKTAVDLPARTTERPRRSQAQCRSFHQQRRRNKMLRSSTCGIPYVFRSEMRHCRVVGARGSSGAFGTCFSYTIHSTQAVHSFKLSYSSELDLCAEPKTAAEDEECASE